MNKIAVVTGVSRLKGIGRAICIELAKRKFDVFFTYWTPYDNQMPWKVKANEPDLIVKEIKNLGVNCAKLELDLCHIDSVKKLFTEVISKLGNPHVLVNNATYSTKTNIKSLSALELDNHYKLNVKATTLLTLGFVKQFAFKEDGKVVNLTSGQSQGPMPNSIAYAITKGAIETLTTTIAQELALKGITINAVNPGPNDTGWMNDELKEKLLAQFPMKRLGKPEDAANLIGFLVSKEANWITGQIIHSEGGFKR